MAIRDILKMLKQEVRATLLLMLAAVFFVFFPVVVISFLWQEILQAWRVGDEWNCRFSDWLSAGLHDCDKVDADNMKSKVREHWQ